jgi:hypothetical protein
MLFSSKPNSGAKFVRLKNDLKHHNHYVAFMYDEKDDTKQTTVHYERIIKWPFRINLYRRTV